MKRLFLALGVVACFAGCATTQSGTSVDYQTLATNACSLATSEINALQLVRANLSTNDQASLDKIAPLVSQGCAALESALSNPQSVYTTLLTLLPDLTIIIADNKGS